MWGWRAVAFRFGVIFVYVCMIGKPHGFLLALQCTDSRESSHKAMIDGQGSGIYIAALNVIESNLLLFLPTFALRSFQVLSCMPISLKDDILLGSSNLVMWLVK